MYYLLFASVLRKHLSDLVLMIILSIPSALALLPAIFFLGGEKEEEKSTVLENKSATNNYNSVVETKHS